MLEGGDGASGALTLLRDVDLSRVADLDLEREDRSSGLKDIFASKGTRSDRGIVYEKKSMKCVILLHELSEQTILSPSVLLITSPVRPSQISFMHAGGGASLGDTCEVTSANLTNERGWKRMGARSLRSIECFITVSYLSSRFCQRQHPDRVLWLGSGWKAIRQTGLVVSRSSRGNKVLTSRLGSISEHQPHRGDEPQRFLNPYMWKVLSSFCCSDLKSDLLRR